MLPIIFSPAVRAWRRRATRLALLALPVLISQSCSVARPAGAAQSVSVPGVRTVWADALDGAMVSPNGKWVAFVDWDVSAVAVRDAVTGTSRQLRDASSQGFPEPYFAFSPDSHHLAFPFGNNLTGAPFRYELRSIDLGTGAHEVLAEFPTDLDHVAPLAWHATAGILLTTLAADTSSELLLLNPDTKHLRVLQRRAAGAGVTWQALFTRDGNGLVILASDKLSWVDVATGSERSLGLDAQVLLGWDADERALRFHSVRGDDTGNWSVALSQGVPVGDPLLLQRTAPGVRWAGRGPEGVYYLEPVQTSALFVADIDVATGRMTSAPRRILPAPGRIAGHPAWSRDGSRLAYTLAVANRHESRIFAAEGVSAAPRELASLDLRVTALDWSADGRFLIVGGRAWTRARSWIGRIDAVSGAIQKLATGVPASAVAAGAGEEVVFTRAALAGSRDVHVMHLKGPGATPRVLATYTIGDLPRSMSVSPDGRWVALLKSVPQTRATALVLIPTASGEPRTVLQVQRPDALELNQGSVPWTSDGRSVLLLMRRLGQRHLAAVGVDSGEVSPLPFAPQATGRWHLALHPNGRHLVYVDGGGRDELKVMLESRRGTALHPG